MKGTNQLIITTVICVLYTVTGYAGLKNNEPSELTKLRKEYGNKAQSEIAPVNARYLVLLERMEKSFLRSGDKDDAMAVRQEIERFEANPVHLLTFKADIRKAYEGKYEAHNYDGTKNKNTYHYVEIEKSGPESLRWTNRNGDEWILTPTDNPLIFNIGKDCPFYVHGEHAVTFKIKDRVIVGVKFLDERDYYDKQDQFSN